jgi:putative endopeptidase
VIGHEMIHGYDDQGSRFGANRQLRELVDDEDAKGFEALTDKLVEQFNGYEAHAGLQGQRQADPGREHRRPRRPGRRLRRDEARAWARIQDPMIDGYTQEQRFFMNWATVWRRNFTGEELKCACETDSHAPAHSAPSARPRTVCRYENSARTRREAREFPGLAFLRPDDRAAPY